MAKKEQVEMVVPPKAELPAYLRDKSAKGLEATREYILKQRIKVVQKQAGSALLDLFPAGTVLLAPSNAVVAAMKLDDKNKPTKVSERFSFTPLFFFPSWGIVNDIKLKGTEPMFLKYTIDPTDPLVVKCRAKETREEAHPTKTGFLVKNVEMLNFVCLIYDDKFIETPIIMTFQRGEWVNGSNFLSRIKNTRASIFARRWEASSSLRTRGTNEWNGLDIAEPETDSAWVTEEQYASFEMAHDLLKKEHAEQGIKPEDLEDLGGEGGADGAAEKPAY